MSLLATGGVRDGYNYVYKLWRSLLYKWFMSAGTRTFMSTPLLDERCLAEIIDLSLPNHASADIVSFFLRRKCKDDPYNTIIDMKRKLIGKYPAETQSLIEDRVFSRFVYPSCSFNTKFVAGLKDGTAQVMLTSANFTMDNFLSGNMEHVVMLTMDERTFVNEYLAPLADQAISLE